MRFGIVYGLFTFFMERSTKISPRYFLKNFAYVLCYFIGYLPSFLCKGVCMCDTGQFFRSFHVLELFVGYLLYFLESLGILVYFIGCLKLLFIV